jgi:hypothetical protein
MMPKQLQDKVSTQPPLLIDRQGREREAENRAVFINLFMSSTQEKYIKVIELFVSCHKLKEKNGEIDLRRWRVIDICRKDSLFLLFEAGPPI